MAAVKTKTAGNANKTSFGDRRKGKANKSVNKHNHTERNYRGQGR